MAKYRAVYTKIWKDPDFQQLSMEDQHLFLYLITNDSVTESGLYPITAKTIAHETNIPQATVEQRLNNGFYRNVLWDKDNSIVFVRNFRRYAGVSGGRPELIKQSIQHDFNVTRRSSLWVEFVKEYPPLTPPNYSILYYNLIEPLSNGSPTVGNIEDLLATFKDDYVPVLYRRIGDGQGGLLADLMIDVDRPLFERAYQEGYIHLTDEYLINTANDPTEWFYMDEMPEYIKDSLER